MKKVVSILIAWVMVATMLATVTITANAYSVPDEAGFTDKLRSLRSQFPNGGYYSGTYYENGVAKAWECHGYALECFEQVFGIQYYKSGYYNRRDYTMGTIYAGDVVRTGNDSHTIFITKVDGDRIYYTDANYWPAKYGANYVRWDESYTYSELLSVFTYKVHVPENYLTGSGLKFTPVDVGTDFYANIVNLEAGNCLTVLDGNVASCAKTGADNQKWRFERQGDTSYKIINVGSNRCLDVNGAGSDNRTNIQVYDSNNSNAQRWYFRYNGNGLSLVPKCALNSAIDLDNGNTADGTNIQLWSFLEGNQSGVHQIFGLNTQPSFSSINLGRDFTGYIVYNQTGSVVTVDSSGNVVVRPYDGSLIQRWNFQRMSDRAYKITNASTGKCLDVAGGNSANKTNIGTYQSNDTAAQRWFVRMNGNGFSFVPKCAVNSAMDLDNGITDNSSNIHEYSYIDNGPHQVFSIQYSINAIEVKEYNDHVYVAYNYEIPWREAYKFCEQQGGHLVTINTSGEQKFILDLLKSTNYRQYLWLGALDAYSEGKWNWITGETMSFTNWATGEPNDSNDEDYMMLYRESGKWNDCHDGYNDFSDSYCFICEYENKSSVPVFSSEKSFEYSGHKYEFYSNNVDWQTAKRFCEQKGGHLATITNSAENNAIMDNTTGLSRAGYWIGLTDIQAEGNWKWITGESLSFKNWDTNEPNNAFGVEDYGEFYSSNGKWNDTKGFFCSYNTIGFICEYDVISPDPTEPPVGTKKLLGDVDGDSDVEIRDSTWIQRHVAKEEMPFVINKTTADVDDDGIVTVMDATAIQYYLANMKTTYKIGEKIE